MTRLHAMLGSLAAATTLCTCNAATAQNLAPAMSTAVPGVMAPAAAAAPALPVPLDLGDCPDVGGGLQIGKTYTCACPASAPPDLAMGASPIYGAMVYTDDSNVCIAALHAGALKANVAGHIVVRVITSPAAFRGTTQNGVKSQVWATASSTAFQFTPAN